MILKSLEFKNFRNFISEKFYFHKSLTVIIGQNAIGKTNILEGVHISSNTKGFRETKEEELITFNKKLTHIRSLWIKEKQEVVQNIIIGSFHNQLKKKYSINKINKRQNDYISFSVPSIVFSPGFLYLIDNGNEERRNYFNIIISTIDPHYRYHLSQYEQSLRKRNKLLQIVQDKEALKKQLIFWDEKLVDHANYITKERSSMFDFFNKNGKNGNNTFEIIYKPNLMTLDLLKDNLNLQMAIKQTRIGPQRDQIEVLINNKSSHSFGSRSEQRFALLWLTLVSLKVYEEYKIKPILLLDDIFSELDTKNKKVIMDLIGNYQTILTTTENSIFSFLPKSHEVIEL